MRRRTPLSLVPLVPLLLALGIPSRAPGQVSDRVPSGVRGLVGTDHLVCREWIDAWARGGPDPGLATWGAIVAGAYRSGAPSQGGGDSGAGLAGLRLRERFAFGGELEGSSGPRLAGATVARAESGGYLYPGPSPDHESAVGLRIRGELSLGRAVLAGDVTTANDGVRTRVLDLGVEAGPLSVIGGSLALRAGPGCRGGLVLGASDRTGAWGVELRQRTPLTLPWLGPLRVGVQVGALPEAGPGNRRPLFHSMRIELRPHRDWVVGLNRAVIFGGSDTDVAITPRTVALMLVGLTDTPEKSTAFENQVASVDVRWRGRAWGEAMLVSAEYGTDDSGWAFLNVPGMRVATERSLGAGAGWVGLAGTWVAGSRGTYPPWYRHGALAWGWTDRGRPLGNPLGGQARALLGTYRWEGERLVLESAAGVVDRGPENLFAPDLEGGGVHGSLEVLWSPGAWEVSLSATVEAARTTATRWSASVMRRFSVPSRVARVMDGRLGAT